MYFRLPRLPWSAREANGVHGLPEIATLSDVYLKVGIVAKLELALTEVAETL